MLHLPALVRNLVVQHWLVEPQAAALFARARVRAPLETVVLQVVLIVVVVPLGVGVDGAKKLVAHDVVHRVQRPRPAQPRAPLQRVHRVAQLVRVVHLLAHLREDLGRLRVEQQNDVVLAQGFRHRVERVDAHLVADGQALLCLARRAREPPARDRGVRRLDRAGDVLDRPLAEHGEQHAAVLVGEVREAVPDVGVVQHAARQNVRGEIHRRLAEHRPGLRPVAQSLKHASRLVRGELREDRGARRAVRVLTLEALDDPLGADAATLGRRRRAAAPGGLFPAPGASSSSFASSSSGRSSSPSSSASSALSAGLIFAANAS